MLTSVDTRNGADVALWTAASLGTSLLCTFAFACATPLAGLAAIAALKLPRRDALGVAGATWLANQAVGFAFLHYPLAWNTSGWAAAIGVATLGACAAARESVRVLSVPLRYAIALLAAFAAYEGLLFAATSVLGGTGAFAATIVARIFAINAAAFLVLAIASVALRSLSWRKPALVELPARS